MATQQDFFSNTNLLPSDYCVFGAATCFVRSEEGVQEVSVLEPIPSAALEALLKGIPTSYSIAYATTLDAVIKSDRLNIPRQLGDNLQIPDDFLECTAAAVRTYKRRPQAKEHIEIGATHEDFNHSTAKKRVLNQENIVSTDDNVKQHSHTHKVL